MGSDAPGWPGLRDAVCAVTGAGGGLGRAIALALANAGARVALLDRSAESGTSTLATIREASGQAEFFACDVSDEASIAAAADACAERLGPCRVLVNNAALLLPGALETLPLAEWNAVISVNLTGYFLCAQAFARQMRRLGGGSIVHVASIAAEHPQGFSGAYSVGKAGVVMLSRQLALEWGPQGIRSNVVSPGLVQTPMSRGFYEDADLRRRREAAVPQGRIGRPEDIADTVLFLAGDSAAYVNGVNITVDGGFTRGLMSMIPRPGHVPAAAT